MRALYFIEATDGTKYYKCDTFWSKSHKRTHAKIHEDTQYDKDRFFTSLIYGFKPYKGEELSDEDYTVFKKYVGGLYGYQTIIDEVTPETQFTIKEDTNISEPVYLRQIVSIDRKGEVDSIDYKVINRDLKINSIIQNTIMESYI